MPGTFKESGRVTTIINRLLIYQGEAERSEFNSTPLLSKNYRIAGCVLVIRDLAVPAIVAFQSINESTGTTS